MSVCLYVFMSLCLSAFPSFLLFKLLTFVQTSTLSLLGIFIGGSVSGYDGHPGDLIHRPSRPYHAEGEAEQDGKGRKGCIYS